VYASQLKPECWLKRITAQWHKFRQARKAAEYGRAPLPWIGPGRLSPQTRKSKSFAQHSNASSPTDRELETQDKKKKGNGLHPGDVRSQDDRGNPDTVEQIRYRR